MSGPRRATRVQKASRRSSRSSGLLPASSADTAAASPQALGHRDGSRDGAEGTADARVVAAACRQAVLVGRKHHTPALELNALKSRLHKVGVDVVGVILNDH